MRSAGHMTCPGIRIRPPWWLAKYVPPMCRWATNVNIQVMHGEGRNLEAEERRGGEEWRDWCDWSSAVCSSDLYQDPPAMVAGEVRAPYVPLGNERKHSGHARRVSESSSKITLCNRDVGRCSGGEQVKRTYVCFLLPGPSLFVVNRNPPYGT